MPCKPGCGEGWHKGMVQATKQAQLKIRRVKKSDAEQVAVLSGQLGYPATSAQILRRIKGLKPASEHAVFVADLPGTGIVGWLHVSVAHLLESHTRAEVNGLVVAEGQRSLGAGALLLDAAEKWARQHRCTAMNVRSNVIRERAHKFYERLGYEHYKSQKAFRKTL
jgi:GNAT superfamily N-acetyltransferase